MDPFLEFEIKGKKYKTKVHRDGGNNPVWGSDLEIPISSINDQIKVSCFDEDVFMNKCVGEFIFRVRDLVFFN